MARLRISAPAQADIAAILHTSEALHGQSARARYRDLIAAALRTIARAPGMPPSVARDAILPGLRSLQLRAARGRRTGVRDPVHIVFYSTGPDGSVAVLRVLHVRMDPTHRFEGA